MPSQPLAGISRPCKGADSLPACQSLICDMNALQVAFIGFIGQHAATGEAPLQALKTHLANPWTNNFATNGVSLPF